MIECPQCHSKAGIEGKIYNQIDYVNPPAYFRPSSMPFYAIFKTNIQLQNSFCACSFCGFLWSKINNQELQQAVVSKDAF
ncbi:MAG: hypothetical protein ABIH27_03995 [Candidatus Omnitrophota bacterium]